MKKPFRQKATRVLTIAVLIAFLVFAQYAAFIYLGGYWENHPLFRRISGPMRFKQFVSSDLPDAVYDMKGGYSGFPQGIILTRFRYRGLVKNLPFLEDWESVAMNETTHYAAPYFPYLDDVKATAIYRKSRHNTFIYLLIGEQTKEGLLLVP